MKTSFVLLALGCTGLAGCAQAVRGNADQVYIDKSFALTDAQSIDEANKYCGQYGKIALYRGDYSGNTKVFACIRSSEQQASANAVNGNVSTLSVLLKSAEIGDVDAMLKLGILYSDSKTSGVPSDDNQAMFWLHRAANLGSTNAMTLIGAAYIKGGIGVSADPAQAMQYLRKAADLGNPSSMALVGAMFYQGIGVNVDTAEAARWFHKAADLGEVTAMKQLAEMYEKGIGVPVDKPEALRWYQKAAAKHN